MNRIFSIKRTSEPVGVIENENQPIKVDLSNYAFVVAGRTGGDPSVFSSYLDQIRDGHIISESHDEAKQQAEKKKKEEEIDLVENEVRKAETKIKDLEEIKMPV